MLPGDSTTCPPLPARVAVVLQDDLAVIRVVVRRHTVTSYGVERDALSDGTTADDPGMALAAGSAGVALDGLGPELLAGGLVELGLAQDQPAGRSVAGLDRVGGGDGGCEHFLLLLGWVQGASVEARTDAGAWPFEAVFDLHEIGKRLAFALATLEDQLELTELFFQICGEHVVEDLVQRGGRLIGLIPVVGEADRLALGARGGERAVVGIDPTATQLDRQIATRVQRLAAVTRLGGLGAGCRGTSHCAPLLGWLVAYKYHYSTSSIKCQQKYPQNGGKSVTCVVK